MVAGVRASFEETLNAQLKIKLFGWVRRKDSKEK